MIRSSFRSWALVTGLALLASACGPVAPSAPATPTAAASQPTSATVAPTSGPPIKIGIIEDLSGPSSYYSQVTVKGIRAAAAQINASGGVLGRPLELLAESDNGEPSQAPALARRLISNGVTAILMASGSASALQVKPVVAEAKVVYLAPTNLNTNIAKAPGNEYSFMMGVPSTNLGTVFTEAFKRANVKRVGFFTDDSATIAGTTAPILKAIRDAGIEIVAEEKASSRATDVTAQVARIQNSNPDVVYSHSLGGPFEAAFFNAVSEAMPNVMRVSGPSLCSEPEVWALARPNALDGIICGGNVTLDNPRTVAANAAIRSFVGPSYPGITAFDAQGYDSVFLLKLAIENAGSADDPAAIKGGMEKITRYQASWGNTDFTISYSAEKHNGADGICGVVFSVFKGNQPGGSWNVYQPSC